MGAGLGSPGRNVTAVLAVLLTMGTMNAYVAAATRLAGALAEEGSAPAALARPTVGLAMLAAVSAPLIGLLAADVLSVESLVRASSAAFVAVYAPSTAAGIRLLDGPARWAAAVSFVAMLVVLAFSGPFLVVPAAVAVTALLAARRSNRRRAVAPGP
jgi:amino acid efflux transporter